MQGFDAEFIDYEHYILSITDRIWKDKNIGAISRYYSRDAVIHTLGGPVHGSEAVMNGTIKTLAAFPDRLLNAEAVICTGNDEAGYYSSHRIISPDMTHLGHSEFGPPTGKQATVRTIADCLAKENQIHEEWLMRDNLALVQQLGFEPHEVAQKLAAENQDNEPLHDWLAAEIERIATQPPVPLSANIAELKTDWTAYAEHIFSGLWQKRDISVIDKLYAPEAAVHAPAGREMTGHGQIKAGINELLSTLSDTRISVDHVCSARRNDEETDLALRWVLTGRHDNDGIYGAASHKTLLYLIATHLRIHQGRITEEWTVFDELAVLRQIYT